MASPYSTAGLPQDYIDYDSGPAAIRAISAVIALTTIIVGLRIWMRLHRRTGMGIDDWLIIASLIIVWGEYVIDYLCITEGGVGRHTIVNLSRDPDAIRNTMIYMFAGELTFFTGLAMIKWSILFMYFRIFPTRFMRWGCTILGVTNLLWWMAVMIATGLQCKPISHMWDVYGEGTCVDSGVFYISTNGVPNIVIDFLILCLPIYPIWNLQLSAIKRAAIAANFLIGAIVIISSCIKLKVMIDLYHEGPTADLTFSLQPLLIWVEVEPCVGIISACLPPLRPLLSMATRQLGFTRDRSTNRATPDKPTLVTFGGSNGRKNKNQGFSTIASLDQKEDSTERLAEEYNGHTQNGTYQAPDWSPQSRTLRSAVISGGAPVQHEIPMHSINVRTEVDWREHHAQDAQPGRGY